jgi:hypothetical protein
MKNIQIKYKLNFKTMKKGLLTLLAASLVFVGCQNYDDQFDDLNAQISALKSQVDGLSSLSGQVSALSGTIAGLQSGVAAAQASADAANTAASGIDLSGLSASLATLQAEVDAVQASLATAATASAVAALQTELDALEADLDDLLVSNNVYSTAITITDAASMASALALGNKVALMNNTVSITDAATVADTDIQTFVNRIKTMNGAFTYDSGSATGFVPTFDEMTAAKAITLTTAGDISFKKLTSATTIRINDDYETKITSVDFGALTSLTDFTDDAVVKKINLTNATNIDLASLGRLTSTSADPFEITMKKGGTLDISSLDDVSTAGAQEDLYLDIDGAASVTFSNIYDGDLGFTNVATVSVSSFIGTIDIDSGVETLTVVDGVNVDMAGSSDLVTATLDFAYDSDTALTAAQATIAAAGYSSTYTEDLDDGTIDFTDLESLTVTGNLLDLYVDGTDLVTLSIDATMHDLTITGATDLTTLTVASGSKIGNINLTGTTNLAVADFNHTSNLTDTDATAQASVTFSATNNSGLTKLHSTGDDVGTLTVTGNDALAELDFTGLKDDGADTTPAANVYDNNLTAVKATDSSDGETDKASGAAGDLGSFDDGTSGMDTLKTYLTHVVADADFAGYVSFDTVSTVDDTETAGTTTTTLNVTYTSATTWNAATVLYEVAGASSGGGSATKAKRSYLLDISEITQAQFTANGQDLLDINGDGVPALYVFTGQTQASVIAALNDSDNKALATANGVTMNAAAGGNSTLAVHVGSQLNSALWETSNAIVTNLHLTASDVINLTVGNQTVTLTAATSNASYEVYAVAKSVGAAIATRWAAVNTGASAPIFNFTGTVAQASSTIDGDTGHMLTFTAKDKGTSGAGLSASLTLSALDSTGNNGTLPVSYGATSLTSDNTSTGPDVVLTFESNTAGVLGNVIGNPATSATSGTFSAATLSHAATGIAGITELHSNFLANAGTNKVTSTDGQHDESRSDVVYPENDVAATVTTTAVAKSRLTWL